MTMIESVDKSLL